MINHVQYLTLNVILSTHAINICTNICLIITRDLWRVDGATGFAGYYRSRKNLRRKIQFCKSSILSAKASSRFVANLINAAMLVHFLISRLRTSKKITCCRIAGYNIIQRLE